MKKIIFSLITFLIISNAYSQTNCYTAPATAGTSLAAGATDNTILGAYAGTTISTDDFCTFLGAHSGENATGNENTFVGIYSGYSTTGGSNTFLGSQAGRSNTSGSANIYIGRKAGYSKQTGTRNIFIGVGSGQTNNSGDYSVLLGYQSGYTNSGSNNCYLGYQTGYSNSGNDNIFIGYQAGYNESNTSDKLIIENSNSGTPLIEGDFDADELTLNAKVGIGTDPLYKLHVVGSGTDSYFRSNGHATENIGSYSYAYGTNDSAEVSKGVYAEGSDGYLNYGVMGYATKNSSAYAGYNYGIYGRANNSYGTDYGGYFYGSDYGVYAENGPSGVAGYFNGAVWASSYNTISDIQFKKDVKPILNGLDIIMQLKPSTYSFKNNDFSAMNLPVGNNFGFIAQELEEVLPELVIDSKFDQVMDEKGKVVSKEIKYKAVNYDGMIPILTQAIQEQQEMIKDLKQEIEVLKSQNIHKDQNIQPNSDIDFNLDDFDLSQNEPNPFNTNTTIKYRLGEGYQYAYIGIFNLNGNLIQKYPVEGIGYGFIEVDRQDLNSGMYLYSLIVDGKEIKTLKMIVE